MSYCVVDPPKLKRDYKGRRVRLVRPVKTYLVAIPAGAIGTITKQSPLRSNSGGPRNGSTVEFDKCSCCGVGGIISGLDLGDYEFIDAHVVPPENDTATNPSHLFHLTEG